MASAAEPPGQAAEYLQELTRIVAAQHLRAETSWP